MSDSLREQVQVDMSDSLREQVQAEEDAPLQEMPDIKGVDGAEQLGEKIASQNEGSEYASDEKLEEWWHEHQNTPEDDFEAKNKIIKELDGFAHVAVKPYSQTPTPKGVMYDKAYEEMEKGIEQWDPDKAPLRSYVYGKLFPNNHEGMSVVNKVVEDYGDIVSVNDKQMSEVEKVRDVIEKFQKENGRTPSQSEVADIMGVEEHYASKLMRQASTVHFSDDLIDDDQSFGMGGGKEIDALKTVYNSISGRKKRVMEMVFYPDLGGKEPDAYQENKSSWPVGKEIAEEVGVHESTVSRYRKDIKKRVKRLT